MKRVLFALVAASCLVASIGAQDIQIPALPSAPVSIVPGFNLTVCPPPPNSLAVCSLFTSTTAASNVGVGETDLITYPMPANVLSVNNQKVRIRVWGSAAANVNTKTFKLYFGATQIAAYSVSSATSTVWMGEGFVARTGATAQISNGFFNVSGSGYQGVLAASPTETLSGAVTIKITGQSAVAGGDLTALAMYVEWVP